MVFPISLHSLLLSDVAACLSGALVTALLHGVLQRRKAAASASHDSSSQHWLDHGPDGVLVFGGDLVCSFASASTLRLFGPTAAGFEGMALGAIVGPDEQVAAEAAAANVRAGRPCAEVVFRTARASGEQLWIEMRLCASEAGNAVIASLRDISTRKTAELALRVANLELNRLAGSDGLTDLANRRRFDQTLESECRRASRAGAPVSLLLLDVDRFKSFNDRYGHQAGDACLKEIAVCLRLTASRSSDLAARFGGEEFALLLPGLDRHAAADVAAQVHAAILALGVPHERNPDAGHVVSVSVGCATIQPSPDTLKGSGSQLVAEADRALYDAKRLGRNRIMVPGLQAEAERAAVRSAATDARLLHLAALEATGTLEPAASLSRIAGMATMLLGLPGAFITVLDRDGARVVGQHGMGAEFLLGPSDFSAALLGARSPVVVHKPRADDRLAPFAAEHGLAFVAAAPLLSGDDLQHLGALWVIDRQPRDPLDEGKRMLLSRLAALAMEDIEGRHRASLQQPLGVPAIDGGPRRGMRVGLPGAAA